MLLIVNGLSLLSAAGHPAVSGWAWAALLGLTALLGRARGDTPPGMRAALLGASWFTSMLWNHWLNGYVLWPDILITLLTSALFGLLMSYTVSARIRQNEPHHGS